MPPALKRRAKFTKDEIVVAIESFVTSCLPSGPLSVPAGSRWKGGHEVVRRNQDLFVRDGTPQDELARLRAQIYMRAEADAPLVEAPTARIERRIADRDAFVSIRPLGALLPGTRAERGSEIVKAHPSDFVPVLADVVDRKTALLATARLEHTYEDGTQELVHEGTLVPRDHPAISRHPHTFVLPVPEED